MITLTLDWREVLWWLQGGMSGSHLRWSVYDDMVNKVWPQCNEQERRNIYTIMRRDLGYHWRPEGWKPGIHLKAKAITDGGSMLQVERDAMLVDTVDDAMDWRQDIFDKTPWMYFRQVLARYNPDNQFAVTLRADSRKEAETVVKDARQRGILIERDGDFHPRRSPKNRTVTVRAYGWQGEYRVDWSRRCDKDRIVAVTKLEIPDKGTM